ncbi:Uncharacterised protein [Mycobacteroides abscessus subsp. abscessus]|nr:Uncharacterised protein [Mycobacteroides abscessus subsp. abscessus]
MPARMLSENHGIGMEADKFRRNNLISGLLFQHAILVDA